MFRCQEQNQDTTRLASIETEISPKVEEKETAPTGLQSMHGREDGKFDKKKKHKSETNAQAFHSCTIIHCMTYCIRYMFSYLKQECRVKKMKGFALDKSFRKTFKEKEGNLNRSKFSKISNPNQLTTKCQTK